MSERREKVLIVDDEPRACENMHRFLTREGFTSSYVHSGLEAMEKVAQERPDAILLDIRMPGIDGIETLQRIRTADADCVIIMITALDEFDTAISTIRGGASDFIRKPVSLAELSHALDSALEKRRLVLENREYQRSLEKKVSERTAEIELTRDASMLALATLAEFRDPETGGHLQRIREYSKTLATRLAVSGPYTGEVDGRFIETIFKASPLHDIGKVGIPDHILLKPGRHTPQEFEVMKRHAEIGARTLLKAEEKLVSVMEHSYLSMAKVIAGCHHEKWDGTGYAAGMKGEDIPLSARIMALADVYDACSTKRVYKSAFPHEQTHKIILEAEGRHFDPAVVTAYRDVEHDFIRIREGFAD